MGRLGRIGVAVLCGLIVSPASAPEAAKAAAWRTQPGTPISETAVLVAGVSPLESVPVVSSLAVDSGGTVYVLDRVAQKLLSFTPGQPLSVVIGTRGGGDAADQLSAPRGVAVDALDRVYVADTGNARVLRFTPGEATPETVAGGTGVFVAPRAVAFDELDRMYVLDAEGVVLRFAGFGNGISGERVADGVVAGIASLDPEGLAVGGGEDPDVFVSDTGNDRVLVWRGGAGAVLQTMREPAQMVRHADGVIVAARGEHQALFANVDGVQVIAGDGGATRSQSSIPLVGAVAVDPENRVLTGEDGRVARWESGVMEVLIGEESASTPPSVVAIDATDDGSTYVLDAQQLKRRTRGALVDEVLADSSTPGFPSAPAGVAVAENGDVFISDGAAHRVVRLSGGSFQPVAGSGTAGSSNAELRDPHGIAVDAQGTLYIADTGNDRVVRWAEGAGAGYIIGTGAGSGLSQLSSPHDVDVTPDGDVVVADTGNDRVVRWAEGVDEGEVLAGAGVPMSSALPGPVSVAVAPDGTLRIATSPTGAVLTWTPRSPAGVVMFARDVVSAPVSVTADTAARTYVADSHHGSVIAERLDPQLTIMPIADRREGSAPLVLEATAPTAATLTWVVAPSEVCVNDASTVLLVGRGTCEVSVSLSDAWWREMVVTTSFLVLAAPQAPSPPQEPQPEAPGLLSPEVVEVPAQEIAVAPPMQEVAVPTEKLNTLTARCSARGRNATCSAKRPAAFSRTGKVSVTMTCSKGASRQTKKLSTRLSTIRVTVALKRGTWSCSLTMRQGSEVARRTPWRVRVR